MGHDYDLLIRRAQLMSGDVIDIGIVESKIQTVAKRLQGTADHSFDVEKRIVTPSFVDAHIHLNQAFIGDDQRWEHRTLQEMVDNGRIKDTVTIDILVENRLAGKNDLVKILGRGELKAKLNITVHKFTASAKEAIESKGGSITIV